LFTLPTLSGVSHILSLEPEDGGLSSRLYLAQNGFEPRCKGRQIGRRSRGVCYWHERWPRGRLDRKRRLWCPQKGRSRGDQTCAQNRLVHDGQSKHVKHVAQATILTLLQADSLGHVLFQFFGQECHDQRQIELFVQGSRSQRHSVQHMRLNSLRRVRYHHPRQNPCGVSANIRKLPIGTSPLEHDPQPRTTFMVHVWSVLSGEAMEQRTPR
jgi:hypothetical protein